MFITIEGGEGTGKTSLNKALESRLDKEGISFLCTREPGGTSLGERFRDLLLSADKGTSDYAMLLLFLSARAQHIKEVIQPALEQGKIVFCERFHDSTIVYQGIAGGLGKEYVTSMCDKIIGEKPFYPDITFLLDLSPEEGIKRKSLQKTLDSFERKELYFHSNVREGFLNLAKDNPHRYYVIDAAQPLESVVDIVINYIKKDLIARYGEKVHF